DEFGLRRELQAGLGRMQDLERLAGRAVAGTASPKDLVALKQTLWGVAELKRNLAGEANEFLREVRENLGELSDVAALIANAIVDDPPLALKDATYIRPKFDAELDEIRDARSHAREWVARFEAAERKR